MISSFETCARASLDITTADNAKTAEKNIAGNIGGLLFAFAAAVS
jgi:hypothetical protein